jgi:hypothetical protein
MNNENATTEVLRFAVGFGWKCRDEGTSLEETIKEFEKVAEAYPTLPPRPGTVR